MDGSPLEVPTRVHGTYGIQARRARGASRSWRPQREGSVAADAAFNLTMMRSLAPDTVHLERDRQACGVYLGSAINVGTALPPPAVTFNKSAVDSRVSNPSMYSPLETNGAVSYIRS